MSKKRDLSDKEIKRALLDSLKYVGANLMTSIVIFATAFGISLIIGIDSVDGVSFVNGAIIQTVMLPLIIWYYAYLGYTDGYRDSVGNKYNTKTMLVSVIPVVAFQIIFALTAIAQDTPENPVGTAKTIALFLEAPFMIFFQKLPDLMPELLILPCFVPPVAVYVGYKYGRKKELSDHAMQGDAMEFRKKLEDEQYNRK